MARLDARWSHFKTEVTWDDFWQSVSTYGAGDASMPLSAVFAAGGSKATSGTGSLTGTATIAATAKRATSGAGSLSLAQTLALASHRVGVGIGATSATASLSVAAAKAGRGSGAMTLTVTMAAGSPEQHSGTGEMALAAVMAATGSGGSPAVVDEHHAGLFMPRGMAKVVRPRGWAEAPVPSVHGDGFMRLHAVMAADGIRDDDELWLLGLGDFEDQYGRAA